MRNGPIVSSTLNIVMLADILGWSAFEETGEKKKLTTQILRPLMLTNADNDRRRPETWDCYGSSSSWSGTISYYQVERPSRFTEPNTPSLARNKHTPEHTQGGVSAPTPQILRSNSVFCVRLHTWITPSALLILYHTLEAKSTCSPGFSPWLSHVLMRESQGANLLCQTAVGVDGSS
jgi:hypothetical protein